MTLHLATSDQSIDAITNLSVDVQRWLSTYLNSEQRIEMESDEVKDAVESGSAYVLKKAMVEMADDAEKPLGSVFAKIPIPSHLHKEWRLNSLQKDTVFISKLMVQPSLIGDKQASYGRTIISLLRDRFRDKTLVLDCWAGNTKLREFYQDVGFHLQGEFEERDDEETWNIAVFAWSPI